MAEDLLAEYTQGEGNPDNAGDEFVEIGEEDDVGAEYTRKHPLNPFGVYGQWTALHSEVTSSATPNASQAGSITHNFQSFKPVQLVVTKTGTNGFINSPMAGNVPIWGNSTNADMAGYPSTSEVQPNFLGNEIAAGQSISFNYGSSVASEVQRITVYGYAKMAKPVVGTGGGKRLVRVRRK